MMALWMMIVMLTAGIVAVLLVPMALKVEFFKLVFGSEDIQNFFWIWR